MTFLRNLLTAQYAMFATLNPLVAAFFAAAASALAAFHWLNDQWVVMLAKIDAMGAGASGAALNFSACGLMDTFIPLHETLTYFSAWVGVLGVCSAVRMIKSFVPTVAT